MTAVVEIVGLHKRFRRRGSPPRPAVDGFDMQVDRGQVHGFLGPNGSGKTTTLRALLGLVRADAGELRLLGHRAPEQLSAVSARVGAIVESPRFFGNFTARRTLRVLARAGGLRTGAVEEALDRVGLRERGDELVKGYSLGMRQRLAVASALLKGPELLILDEPANGLDPAGIREMRDLTHQLTEAGVTVLVSSHILAEIEQTCDHVTIISRGRRVLSGPVAAVLAGHDSGNLRVRVPDQRRAAQVLHGAGLPVTLHDDHLVVAGAPDPARVNELLGTAGVWASELTPLVPDLESVFLQLTGTTVQPDRRRQVDDTVLPPGGPRAIDLDPVDGTATTAPADAGSEVTA